MEAIGTLCFICKSRKHRYTCPRCNIHYCSVECYKNEKHASCSEYFYRDCFVKELKMRQVSDDEKREVIEMLKRVEAEIPIEDYGGEHFYASLQERLEGIDIHHLKESEVDDLWSRLTPSEQEDFKNCCQSGHNFIAHGMLVNEPWEPWWVYHNSGLVVELENEGKSYASNMPSLIPNLSLLKESVVLKKNISPLIPFNLVNVLYGYVFFQRVYNGCGSTEFVEEFCEFCLQSSSFLKQNETFSNADESICTCIQCCMTWAQAENISVDQKVITECIQDVSHITVGPGPDEVDKYACCALSDLHIAFTKYKGILKRKITGEEQSHATYKEKKKKVFTVIKKLEFLLVWSMSFKPQLSMLSMELSEIYRKRRLDNGVQDEIESRVSELKPQLKVKKEKQLITELT